jgi:hypothetical protein
LIVYLRVPFVRLKNNFRPVIGVLAFWNGGKLKRKAHQLFLLLTCGLNKSSRKIITAVRGSTGQPIANSTTVAEKDVQSPEQTLPRKKTEARE